MTTSAPDLTVVADDRAESNIALWNQFMSKEKISRKISPLISLDAPIQPDKVRFVCISDTHEVLEKLLPKIPMGDVLLHSGDFTNFGSRKAIRAFNEQIGSLPHPHKIVIAGNHEMGFDSPTRFCNGTYQGYKLLTNCTYLENSFTEVYGIRIYGTPHHFLNHWAYYCQPGKEILQKWLNIPTYISDTPIDVLMTHTPPLGHLDWVDNEWHTGNVGCPELLNCVEKRIKPKFHVFGHIHENNGLSTNGETIFINASICDDALNVVDSPIVFDIDLPEGMTKN
uniref:Calcineurin-like phosphoesterase domain-containing protein n=1 Tax=Ditylenchus dipsaci TaxID=166011 RepID=A0A915EPB2_9BILA